MPVYKITEWTEVNRVRTIEAADEWQAQEKFDNGEGEVTFSEVGLEPSESDWQQSGDVEVQES